MKKETKYLYTSYKLLKARNNATSSHTPITKQKLLFRLLISTFLCFAPSISNSENALIYPQKQTSEISGIAAVNTSTFLASHDQKKNEEMAFSIISISHIGKPIKQKYLPLTKEKKGILRDNIADLEAICKDTSSNFFYAFESQNYNSTGGRVLKIELDSATSKIHVVDARRLPPGFSNTNKEGYNLEGALCLGSNEFLISDRESGKIFKTKWNKDTLFLEATKLVSDGLSSEKLTGYNRKISDLSLLGNVIIASAANDPEPKTPEKKDFGPFKSLIYKIGSIDNSGGIHLKGEIEILHHINSYKAEAIEITSRSVSTLYEKSTPYQILMGSDDEKLGGSIQIFALNIPLSVSFRKHSNSSRFDEGEP